VALSAPRLEQGFNPRDGAERVEIHRLADSIRRHGVIQPLVVASSDGEGGHRLIDGERRYRS
jgi:ParB-like chromosome segregation protein Spo0J